MQQPPPPILEKISARLRRSLLVWTLALLAATVAAVLALNWWYSQRTANDQLLEEGTVVSALVTEIDSTLTGLDDMTVVFEWEGEALEYSISSRWFQGWNDDIEGDRIAILFDQENPAFVRIRDQRNYNPFAGPFALVAPMLVVALVAPVRRVRLAMAAAKGTNWLQTRVAIRKGGKLRLVLLELERDVLTSVGSTARGGDLDPGPGWVCRRNRAMVAFHEPSERVIVATLTKTAGVNMRLTDTPAQ